MPQIFGNRSVNRNTTFGLGCGELKVTPVAFPVFVSFPAGLYNWKFVMSLRQMMLRRALNR
jgi:hypothetical protein